MTRREAIKRLLIGVVYLPLDYFVLYPLAFFVGIIVAAIDILLTILTPWSFDRESRSARFWEEISQVPTWIFSGDSRDKPDWIP